MSKRVVCLPLPPLPPPNTHTGFARFLAFKPPYDNPEYVAWGGIVNSTADILEGNCWADVKGSAKSFRINVRVCA